MAVGKKWLGRVALFVLFGPFAFVFLFALTGEKMPDGGPFMVWFLASMTIAGVVSTADFAKSVRQHGISELGCVIPIAAFTVWVGYMLVREIGLLK
jgi:hypothetical protein